MQNKEIEVLFKQSFDEVRWKATLKSLFRNFDLYKTEIERLDKNLEYHKKAESIKEFASTLLADNKVIKFYDVVLAGEPDVAKSRVGLRNLIARDAVPGDVDGILAVFRSKKGTTWRLTFISKAVFWDDDFNEQKLQTSPRRYTYVLGEGESVKTAVKQFEGLFEKQVTIKQLIEAFNVDKLNKRFFKDYQDHYEKFVLFLTGEAWKKKQGKYVLTKVQEASPLLNSAFYGNKKQARDFCKKLLGRIVFLHFLQKKGWMGCNPNEKGWKDGEKQFLLELFKGFEPKEQFHSKCLTELFFHTLNKPDRKDLFKIEGLKNELNGSKVPYLNGGLFEKDTNCDPFKIDFPASYFEELLDFFGQYNFTIDENSPDDQEIGIDPEMLGHIFENLLEENKEKGAFYTPKEIVRYMTQESLIQYLQTHLGEYQELADFIRNNHIGQEEGNKNFIRKNARRIEELLDNVKICDPAIGSGAFPMGMLTEIYEAKMALDMTLDPAEVKKGIIQNSIYGVDLESGAVDIARLRFWLALVVDEEEPHALPNLDYKIMQGNSLLESFEGIDLSEIHEDAAILIDESESKMTLFSHELKRQKGKSGEKLQDLISAYFDLDDPEEKRIQHSKIDQQVLNNIYFCLSDKKKELEKEHKKLVELIEKTSLRLSNADQRLKYKTDSKDAKALGKTLIELGKLAEKQLRLKELFGSNERPFFLWHLMFKEILIDQRGFDIVIGNPPYIKEDENRSAFNEYRNISPYYKGKMDLWYGFACQGIDLLKEKGIECFIAQNNWVTSSGASLLREKVLRETKILKFTDFWNYKVFESAGIQTMIVLLSKEVPKSSYLLQYSVLRSDKISKSQLAEFLSFNHSNSYAQKHVISFQNSHYLNSIITFNPPEIERVLSLIDVKGAHHLNEIEIFSGIDVLQDFVSKKHLDRMPNAEIGDGVFCLSDKEFNSMPFNLKELDLIKPFYTSKELGKYSADERNKYWIIYTDSSFKNEDKIEDYPTIKNHLDKYSKILTSVNKPYGLHRSREEDIFKGEKILALRKAPNNPVFTYCPFDCYVNRSFMIIKSERFNLKYLTALFNSTLIKFWLRYKGKMQGNNFQLDKDPLISIPILEPANVSIFELLVDYLIFLNRSDVDSPKQKLQIVYFEQILDALFYEVYFPEIMVSSNRSIMSSLEEIPLLTEDLSDELKHQIIDGVFERLNDKNHIVRNNLFYLRSIDEFAIIEGLKN